MENVITPVSRPEIAPEPPKFVVAKKRGGVAIVGPQKGDSLSGNLVIPTQIDGKRVVPLLKSFE